MTNTNGFHLAGVSGGVVLRLQSSKSNLINGPEIYGNLICTFSNPLVGVVKSQVSLLKSTSMQPDTIRDEMLGQYWNMNDFYEERQSRFWKNIHFFIEIDLLSIQLKTNEETYGNIRFGDQRWGSMYSPLCVRCSTVGMINYGVGSGWNDSRILNLFDPRTVW